MALQDDIHYLTEEEVHRLFEACSKLEHTRHPRELIRLLFEVTYSGGFRISETLGIRKMDLDVQHNRIVLPSTKGGRVKCTKCKGKKVIGTGDAQIDCSKCLGAGKVMKPSVGYVSKSLFDQLTKLTEDYDGSRKVFPVSRQTAFILFRQVGKIAGVEASHARGGDEDKRTETIWPHLLRHSRCVHLLGAGMALNLVMLKMRHKNINTTSTYLKVQPRDVIKREEELEEAIKAKMGKTDD